MSIMSYRNNFLTYWAITLGLWKEDDKIYAFIHYESILFHFDYRLSLFSAAIVRLHLRHISFAFESFMSYFRYFRRFCPLLQPLRLSTDLNAPENPGRENKCNCVILRWCHILVLWLFRSTKKEIATGVVICEKFNVSRAYSTNIYM